MVKYYTVKTEKIEKKHRVCYGYYTDADRVFRGCVGCPNLYECNPTEIREEEIIVDGE